MKERFQLSDDAPLPPEIKTATEFQHTHDTRQGNFALLGGATTAPEGIGGGRRPDAGGLGWGSFGSDPLFLYGY